LEIWDTADIVDVVETSAKNSVNIETVFITLSRALKNKYEKKAQPRSPTFPNTIDNQPKPSLFASLCSVNRCCN
ncbi:Hypothetical predicted protein, partial [Paramuricea clavata]